MTRWVGAVVFVAGCRSADTDPDSDPGVDPGESCAGTAAPFGLGPATKGIDVAVADDGLFVLFERIEDGLPVHHLGHFACDGSPIGDPVRLGGSVASYGARQMSVADDGITVLITDNTATWLQRVSTDLSAGEPTEVRVDGQAVIGTTLVRHDGRPHLAVSRHQREGDLVFLDVRTDGTLVELGRFGSYAALARAASGNRLHVAWTENAGADYGLYQAGAGDEVSRLLATPIPSPFGFAIGARGDRVLTAWGDGAAVIVQDGGGVRSELEASATTIRAMDLSETGGLMAEFSGARRLISFADPPGEVTILGMSPLFETADVLWLAGDTWLVTGYNVEGEAEGRVEVVTVD